MNAKISIVVPIYDVEDYLEDCIESILASSFKDIEIFLIDDGSTDKSGEICDIFCLKDHRCQVIHKKNEGLSATRNLGLSLAKTEYISFIDGDDYIHPQMLELLYKTLMDFPECAFSMCDFNRARKSYTEIKKDIKHIETIKPHIISQEEFVSNLSYRHDFKYIAAWNKLFRKSFIGNVRFKESGAEDFHFHSHLLHIIKNIVFINKELYYWVQRESSITHQRLNKKYIDRLDVYSECYITIKNNCPQYAHHYLTRIYKLMLNLKYAARNTELKDYTNAKVKHYLYLYSKSFLTCKNIPINLRYTILFF